MSDPDHPRLPGSLRTLCEAAPGFGVSTEQCLENTGLSPFDLYSSEPQISTSQELTAIANFLKRAPDKPGLGIKIGRSYKLSMFGIWGYAILSSPTLRDGLRTAVEFANLSFLIAKLKVIEDGDRAVIRYDMTRLPPELKRFVLERHLTVLTSFARALLPDRIPDQTAIYTTLDDPQFTETLQRELKLPVKTHGKLDAVIFPRALLDHPLPLHDPTELTRCLDQCRALLNRRTPHLKPWAARVRDVVLADINANPKIERVAGQLAVSPRTLNRRLREEKTTFRHTLVTARLALAHELLTTTGLSVSAVAWRVGYSDPSSFVRAYAREHGSPPGVARTAVHSRQ